MGYPIGGRGYRLCLLLTNHFFNSGNVIFDETTPYCSMHSIPNSANTYDSFSSKSLSSAAANTLDCSPSPSSAQLHSDHLDDPPVDIDSHLPMTDNMNLPPLESSNLPTTLPNMTVTPPSPSSSSLSPTCPPRSPLCRSSCERKLMEKGVV
jgi:hypothetical protein